MLSILSIQHSHCLPDSLPLHPSIVADEDGGHELDECVYVEVS